MISDPFFFALDGWIDVLGFAFSAKFRKSLAARWHSGPAIERLVLAGKIVVSLFLAALALVLLVAWLNRQ